MLREMRIGGVWLMALAAAYAQEAAPKPDANGVYAAGPGVTLAKLVHAGKMKVSKEPYFTGAYFFVTLDVVVDADGKPGEIRADRDGIPAAVEAAAKAVQDSKFEPGTLVDGKRISTQVRLYAPFFYPKVRQEITDEKPAPPDAATTKLEVGPREGINKGVSAPVPLNSVEAEYSETARMAHTEGVVLVSLIVDVRGMPQNARIVRTLGSGLDEKALEAVRKYRFRPAMKDGHTPVPVMITVEVNFRR